MGIFFQPDMSKARELTPAMASDVLFPGGQDEDAPVEPDSISFDFLCAIKELPYSGSVLKNLSLV